MPPPTPPRRITRGSLARYAYQASEQAALNSPTNSMPDIEDSVASSSRKRKRGPTNASNGTQSRARKPRVRNNPKEEEDSLESEPEASTPTSAATATPIRATRARAELNKSKYFEPTTTMQGPGTQRAEIKSELDSDDDFEAATPAIVQAAVSGSTRSRRARGRNMAENEIEKTEAKTESNVQATTSATTRRSRKPARKVRAENGEIEVAPPSDWLEIYEQVKKMRLDDGPAANAPVDTMGCERLAEPDATPRDKRFQTLIALMLSSQTKDTVNAVVMKRLQTELEPYAPGAKVGLNLENILAVEPARLNELIRLVGFHNNKTKYIKQAAVILRDKFSGDIPDTIEGLVSLPGVGPKMAHLCMSAAWDQTEGIGVDVHVHRITNLWGWNKTKTPEMTRMALQSWLPRDKWREINWLLVGFGQKVCLSVGPKCGQCELGHQGLCKAADKKKVNDAAKLLRIHQAKAEEEDDGDENDGPVIKQEEFRRTPTPINLPIPSEINDLSVKKEGVATTPSLERNDLRFKKEATKEETLKEETLEEETLKEEEGDHDPRDAAMETIEQQKINSDAIKTEERASEVRAVKREQTSGQVVLRQRTANTSGPPVEGGRFVKQESAGQVADMGAVPQRESRNRSAVAKRESTTGLGDAIVKQEA